jgi:hypothetical protein
MGLLPASPKACSDSCRAVNHNLEYRCHPKRSKRCDVVTRIKKHQKFSSLAPLAFLVLQELFWIRFGKERGSGAEFVGRKRSKSPNLWRFRRCRSIGMPAIGMPDRVEQSAEGVLIHRHLRRRVRLRLTVQRKGSSSLSADRNATLQRLEYVLDDITVHQLPHVDLKPIQLADEGLLGRQGIKPSDRHIHTQ